MPNILATLTRNGVLDTDAPLRLWLNAVGLFVPKEHSPDMEEALALAIDSTVGAYDAQYGALARALKTQLVSEDRKLQLRFPQRVTSMAQIVGAP
jgi:predicted nucleic acid-binding protein